MFQIFIRTLATSENILVMADCTHDQILLGIFNYQLSAINNLPDTNDFLNKFSKKFNHIYEL